MKRGILILSIITLLSSCTCSEKSATMEKGTFAHNVYFWLKDPENILEREAFKESLFKFINNSEFIKTKMVGTPADTDRGVIDNTYTFSLILTFENKAAQDKYQVEDVHLKFIEESSDLWEKVLVYDSENILK